MTQLFTYLYIFPEDVSIRESSLKPAEDELTQIRQNILKVLRYNLDEARFEELKSNGTWE